MTESETAVHDALAELRRIASLLLSAIPLDRGRYDEIDEAFEAFDKHLARIGPDPAHVPPAGSVDEEIAAVRAQRERLERMK